MEIFLENSEGKQVCFRHAVKAVMKNDESFSIKSFDDSD